MNAHQEGICKGNSYRDFYGRIHDCNCLICNNPHQEASKEWKERFNEQFPDGLGKNDWFEVIDFIKSLLTSHSEAIRERVMTLHPIYDIHDKPHVSLDDILALIGKE